MRGVPVFTGAWWDDEICLLVVLRLGLNFGASVSPQISNPRRLSDRADADEEPPPLPEKVLPVAKVVAFGLWQQQTFGGIIKKGKRKRKDLVA